MTLMRIKYDTPVKVPTAEERGFSHHRRTHAESAPDKFLSHVFGLDFLDNLGKPGRVDFQPVFPDGKAPLKLKDNPPTYNSEMQVVGENGRNIHTEINIPSTPLISVTPESFAQFLFKVDQYNARTSLYGKSIVTSGEVPDVEASNGETLRLDGDYVTWIHTFQFTCACHWKKVSEGEYNIHLILDPATNGHDWPFKCTGYDWNITVKNNPSGHGVLVVSDLRVDASVIGITVPASITTPRLTASVTEFIQEQLIAFANQS